MVTSEPVDAVNRVRMVQCSSPVSSEHQSADIPLYSSGRVQTGFWVKAGDGPRPPAAGTAFPPRPWSERRELGDNLGPSICSIVHDGEVSNQRPSSFVGLIVRLRLARSTSRGWKFQRLRHLVGSSGHELLDMEVVDAGGTVYLFHVSSGI